MQAATRLLAAFLLLIATFLVLVGFAVVNLVTAGQHWLAAVVATAGLAGLVAGTVTYWLLRRDPDADELLIELPRQPQPLPPPQSDRAPLRVQAMPVADLPPAYVDAVLKGAQARLSAMKAGAGRG
jgi:hypothetical protein